MMINRLCMIFVDILFPDKTAIKRPAIDILITATRKAIIAGTAGFACHMVPMRNGARTGSAPMMKNMPVVLRDSFG